MATRNVTSDLGYVENHSIGIIVLQAGTLVLICIFGLLGNVCICLMMSRRRHLRTTSNWTIIHLAISDLLKIVFSVSVSLAVVITRKWTFGDLFCKINGFYTLLFLSGSLLSVTLISVNRYFLVVRANRYKKLYTKRKIKLMICGIWMFATTSALPPCFGWGRYGFYKSRATCFIVLGSSNSYTTFLVVAYIATPLSVMLWCYCKIFHAVRESQKRVRGAVCENNPRPVRAQLKTTSAKEVKVAKTVLLLLSVYMVLWIPILIFHFIRVSGVTRIPEGVDVAAAMLVSFSTVTNPWIYGFKHTQFRQQLRKMFFLRTVAQDLERDPSQH